MANYEIMHDYQFPLEFLFLFSVIIPLHVENTFEFFCSSLIFVILPLILHGILSLIVFLNSGSSNVVDGTEDIVSPWRLGVLSS